MQTKPNIITIISDWGLRDHYVASFKGALMSKAPDAVIVDISHEVNKYQLKQAAFILKNSWKNFPEGTIHIIGVKSIESVECPHVVVQSNKHFFIGTDNGFFDLCIDTPIDRAIALDIIQDSPYYTFPERDRFIKAAVHILRGEPLEELGHELEKLKEFYKIQPVFYNNVITAHVVYIDSYGNVYFNLTKAEFDNWVGAKKIRIEYKGYEIQFVKAYDDVEISKACSFFSSSGFLQVAINMGSAANLLGIDDSSNIKITVLI